LSDNQIEAYFVVKRGIGVEGVVTGLVTGLVNREFRYTKAECTVLHRLYEKAVVRIVNAAVRGGWNIRRVSWSKWSVYINLRRIGEKGYYEKRVRVSNHKSCYGTFSRKWEYLIQSGSCGLAYIEGRLSGAIVRSEYRKTSDMARGVPAYVVYGKTLCYWIRRSPCLSGRGRTLASRAIPLPTLPGGGDCDVSDAEGRSDATGADVSVSKGENPVYSLVESVESYEGLEAFAVPVRPKHGKANTAADHKNQWAPGILVDQGAQRIIKR